MPRFGQISDGAAPAARALVATADRRLGAWACEQLSAAGIDVCEQSADLEDATLRAGELRPDLCLLDLKLPGGAIAALERIRALAPGTRVVMLASSADDPDLLSALHAGASGCMVGTPDGHALGRALDDVLAGHTALPRALLTHLVAALRPA